MDFLSEKNVFVTGATGMVGSHVAERLAEAGANAVCLVRSRDPKSYFYGQKLDEKCVSVFGDLKDAGRMADIISRYEIEIIMHVGAQPIVGAALSNPLETFRANVDGTVHVLEAARNSKAVKAIVVASSDKAYGKSEKLPYTEDMPMGGASPYDVSKSCTDLISLAYAKTYGMPVAVTRFGNIYGPGDLNFNRIVPGAIMAGINGTALDIRSDGKMVREYLHVEDVADGYISLAKGIGKAKGEAFNFGSGERLTALEVVEKVGKAMGRKIGTRILNTAKGEIPIQYLSCEKAKKLLGWKPAYNFEKGLELTIPWYRKLAGRKKA
ncbi:GDP-L-fucose synthase [uncultured archaeon]|nr:GDP-L-fucose synthase [uncultured archaeon]